MQVYSVREYKAEVAILVKSRTVISNITNVFTACPRKKFKTKYYGVY